MNTNEPDDVLPGADQISEAYRKAGFDDAPPASLDRAILEAANSRRRHSLFSYWPSFALAATVVLSVSLVLRSGLLNQNAGVSSDAIQSDMPNAMPLEPVTIQQGSPDMLEAGDLDALQAGARDFSTNQTETDSATRTAPEAPEPLRAPAETELRARQTQPVLRQEVEAQSVQPEALSSAAVVLEEAAVSSTAPVCSAIDTGIADEWLACIVTAVEQGQIDSARQELEAFLAVYPEFSLPEELDVLQEF